MKLMLILGLADDVILLICLWLRLMLRNEFVSVLAYDVAALNSRSVTKNATCYVTEKLQSVKLICPG